jgi:VirE N-terminal domain
MSEVVNKQLMVSVYKEFKYNLGERNLIDVLQEIKSDKYQSEVNSIRYALHKGDEKTADEIKSSLNGFTMSGTYGTSRTKANLKTYSQIIGLDFDHIPVTELDTLVKLINDCKYTFASFISPSGEGIKVFIKINSNATQHTTAYNQVATFYKNLSGYDFDAKCKDITRLCFVSYDPEIYIKEDATIFEVQEEATPLPKVQKVETTTFEATDTLLDKCLKFTEQKEQYANGNRNNFIHLFASNANRFGIYEADTLDYCTTNFDLDE